MNVSSMVDVENFWNENPSFPPEFEFDEANFKAFFLAHTKAYFDDVFFGNILKETFIFPNLENKILILDVE